MKILRSLTILALAIFLFTSCTKEESIDTGGTGTPGTGGSGSGSGSGIQGNWKFVSATGSTAISNSVNIGSDVLKTEAISNFTSSNPKGTYSISATNITGNGIGYDHTGTSSTKVYENGVLQNEITLPASGTVPPTNTSSSYKLIGTDSLYFETSAPGTANSGGCKFKLEGTKLTLFMNINTKSLTDLGGTIVSADNIHVNTTIILQKQ